MRTALLLEKFDAARGGAETYTVNLARALLGEGHTVDVFCRVAGEAVPGVTVHELAVPLRPRSARIMGFARACADAVADADLDVVLGIGRTLGQDILRPPGGMLSAARRGTLRSLTNPIELFVRAVGMRLSRSARTTSAIERAQFAPKTCAHYIANSKMVAEDIRRDTGVPDERIHLIYTGVDTERFSPAQCAQRRPSAREAFALETDEIAVLFVAHNFRLKGLEPLLEACARIHQDGGNVRLLVAGAGKREGFERYLRGLSLQQHVRFLGAVPEGLTAYAAADMVVHPTFYDPFSNVTLEAWACGLPAITTRFNGASELMTGKLAKWVVEDPTDSATLAERMSRLLDEGRRADVGAAFRRLAEAHTLSDHCARVVKLFEEVRVEKESR